MLPQKQNKKTCNMPYGQRKGRGKEREKALACIFKLKFLKPDLLLTDLDPKLCVHPNVSTAQHQVLM